MIVVPGLLTGLGHSLMFHTMTSLTLDPFPYAVRGTGSALALMMLDAGTFFGAPILGWIGKGYGFPVLFSAIGGFCLLAAFAYATSGIATVYLHRLFRPVEKQPSPIESP